MKAYNKLSHGNVSLAFNLPYCGTNFITDPFIVNYSVTGMTFMLSWT